MSDFLQVDVGFGDTVGCMALADRLDLDVDCAAGKAQRLWSWLFNRCRDPEHVLERDGIVQASNPDRVLARVMRLEGRAPGAVLEALLEAGLIRLVEEGFEVCGWKDRYGKLFVERESDNERKRAARAKAKDSKRMSGGHPADVQGKSTRNTETETESSKSVFTDCSAVNEGTSPTAIAAAASLEQSVSEFIQFAEGERSRAGMPPAKRTYGKAFQRVADWYDDVTSRHHRFPDWALRQAFSEFVKDPWSRAPGPNGQRRDASLLLFIEEQVFLSHMPREFIPQYDRPLTGEAYG